jgi:hypothetical protein
MENWEEDGRRKKRISNIQHSISNDEVNKRHCRGQEKIVIIVMDCKSIMAPKGSYKKCGNAGKKEELQRISNIQHSISNVQVKEKR